MLINMIELIYLNASICALNFTDLPCPVVNMKSKAFIAFIACPFISLSCMYHGPHDSAKGTTEAEGKATDRKLLRTSPLAVFPSQNKNKKSLF